MSHEENFELLKKGLQWRENETRKASVDVNGLKKGK